VEKIILSEDQKALIEDFGTYIELTGGARSLGKIWGYLLISGTPKSLDDMVNDLQISKGMASLSVRQGVQISLFRKVGISGSKRDFYQLHTKAWALSLNTNIIQGEMMSQYLRRAKKLVLTERAESSIDESIEFFEFVIEQMKKILDQWEERKSSTK